MSGPEKDAAEMNGGRWGRGWRGRGGVEGWSGGGDVVRGKGNKDRGTHKVFESTHAHFITL